MVNLIPTSSYESAFVNAMALLKEQQQRQLSQQELDQLEGYVSVCRHYEPIEVKHG